MDRTRPAGEEEAGEGRDRRADLPRYLLLFGALFLGWGVLSPFLPSVLAARGASAAEVGVLLGVGVAVRLVAMPLGGALADRLGAQAWHATLGPGLATAALMLASGPAYEALGTGGFWAMAALCGLAVPLARGLGPGAEVAPLRMRRAPASRSLRRTGPGS